MDRKISVSYEFADGCVPTAPPGNKAWEKIDKEVMDIAKAMQLSGLKKIELVVCGGDKGSEVGKP